MTTPDVFVHPQALCETDDIGSGTRVWAFAHLLTGSVIGPDCNIGDHCYVEGGARLGRNVTLKNAVAVWAGVTIEDDAFIGPHAAFTNDLRPRASIKKDPSELLPTLVRRGATIGANATLVCGITVGEEAFVAAGAVVIGDVAARAFVAGSPAVRKSWVCTCGEPLGEDLVCARCDRRFRLVDEREGLAPVGAE